MLVNKKNKSGTSGTSRVKFISYTGEYPHLCSGVLTLEIDEKEYKFGHNYSNGRIDDKGVVRFTDEDQKHPNFDQFWSPGGCITSNLEVESGEWNIDVEELPEQFKELADEIDKVFNENVEYGCCGGCI